MGSAFVTTPTAVAALAGLSTPLNELTIEGSGSVTVILVVRSGTLGADPAPGAAVCGAGSTMLLITGAVPQIDAKLATLTYTGTAATDDLSIAVLDGDRSAPPIHVPIAVSGLSSPDDLSTIRIDAGTLMLNTRTLDGPSISLHASSGAGGSPSLVMINSRIGPHSTISSVNDNATAAPRVAVAGLVVWDGTADFAGGPTLLTLAQGAVLRNDGSMHFAGSAAHLTGAGVLENDGTVVIDGAPGKSGALIDAALTGSGTVVLNHGATVSLGRAVASTQTVRFADNASTLRLAAPGSFAGTIAGFREGDRIELADTAATAAFYTPADATGGTLALFNGATLVARLRLATPLAGLDVSLSPAADGALGISLAPSASNRADRIDVYRFFDRTHGTQFLTQDPTERDSIAMTRPDLQYEGAALHALDPASADADAVPVFRFFNQATGTHLFTASADERDTILGTRADLIFEPGSTLFEHARPHAGDVPVYRFFDQTNGAHFLTADAGERATIAATRPDLVAEGVAFYAPT